MTRHTHTIDFAARLSCGSNRAQRRQLRIEGVVAYVPLTKGKEAIIDASDAPFVSQELWYACPRRGGFYAVMRKYNPSGKSVSVYMHRALFGPEADGFDVDHINGDGLDNRRSNLRLVTHAENCRNQVVRANNKSGYRGVHRTETGKWVAQITVNYKAKHLGTFDDVRDAALAYAKASAELHGQFGRF